MSEPLNNPRRVVTGHDDTGNAVIVIDEDVVMEDVPGTPYRRGVNWIINSVGPCSLEDVFSEM